MEKAVSDSFSLLSGLIRRGSIHYNVPGNDPPSLLKNLVDDIVLPAGLDSGRLLDAALEREALMSTAMGGGIALPHPRNPLVTRDEDQLAAIAFPEKSIDWGALDGKKVSTVILVVSASAKHHLSTLRTLSFFCRDEIFCTLLGDRSGADEILSYIEKTEALWLKT